MNQPAIHTFGLTKRFGDFAAVAALDLRVDAGEVFGFLGPNGSGKSTTMRMLVDQLRPSEGRAEIFGLDTHHDSVAARRRVGYLPGDLALYPKMTGRQTVDYFAKLRGGVDESYVADLTRRFKADLSRKVGEYSTGNRQKIGLILAFMHQPDLLILDEPTAGLDPLIQQEFHALVEETRLAGRTVFLSSHTLSEVERVAERVGILREGRLVVVERVDELKAKAIRRLTIEFAQDVPTDLFAGLPGVRDIAVHNDRVADLRYDGSVNDILRAAVEFDVLNLNSEEADLEEVFLEYYRDASALAAGADPDAE
ncbi:MAG: ABC transporter ATP-binding protein, partial [Actinobacteria bacterium]|nr:ABC transporter ATP-binding protein [Actinomycetota bacterium]